MVISKNILDFLKDLHKNNNRGWFNSNKSVYNEVRFEYEMFVELLIRRISKFDEDIGPLAAKDAIFRIFRDVRFSKDKSPYKTHFGAYISKGGRKAALPGYYLHIEPKGSFLAGGIYMPSSDVLKAIRTEIYENTEEFKEIINNSDFKKNFGSLWGEKLKTLPRGFPKEFTDIELLKFKHYVVARNMTDEEVLDKDFLENTIKIFRTMLPLNRFINNTIKHSM
jgi:uncharacterized protein (TIGR02453 family)